ncbi:MAG: serine protease [Clostridia bacterium]
MAIEPWNEEPHGMNMEEEMLQEKQERTRKRIVQILALFVAFGFLLMIFASFFRSVRMPPASVLVESIMLSGDPDIREWKQSVYSVYADGRSGTGFVVDDGRLLLTNHHIIEDASSIRILPLLRNQAANPEWSNHPELDLSVVRLQEPVLASLEMNDAPMPVPGERVIIIGNPYGFFRVAISATVEGYADVPGMDIPVIMFQGNIYQGNSGSPMINLEGKVVGMVFATVSMEDGRSVGLAIPGSEIMKILIP